MRVLFIFNKPKFPLICNIDNNVFVVTERNIIEKFKNLNLEEDKLYEIFDCAGYPKNLNFIKGDIVISFAFRKKLKKIEIITLYNNRKNNQNDLPYSEKTLSSKRRDKILSDIINLLDK